jgi:hypothetical protein
MWSLLFLVLGPSAAGSDWEFHDAAAHHGRNLLTFRAVELGDKPARPLVAQDRPTGKARYGMLAIGTEPADFPALVWLPDSGQLWVDADGDGRFADAERYTLGPGPLEIAAVIHVRHSAQEPQRLKRTIVLRRAPDGGLRYAVRGYVTGSLRLGGQDYSALLTDGNADGCFDSAAHDRVWIDLDRDGRFDGLTEQFPLGKPLTVGMRTYLLKPRPDGSNVQVRERPAQTGTLRLTLMDKPGGKTAAFLAQLVSDWGELVAVNALEQAVSLPVGRYSVDALSFELVDATGRKWQYRFAGGRGFDIEVSAGRPTSVALLRGLKLDMELGAAGKTVRPGDDVSVTPTMRTPAGLYLVNCETCERSADIFTSGHADIRLANAQGATLALDQSGFL